MATKAVKDIYINYSADTKEFDKAQKAVNKELRSNEQLAKQLDKQFKQTFDTNDITPLVKEVQALERAEENAKMQAKKLADELDRIDKEADDFDPVKYNQLAKDLSNAELKASQLNKQIIKTNKNIEAINTGNLDEMSQDFQKAAKSAGLMNDELKETSSIDLGGVVEDVSSLDLSFGGLLESALSLPGPLKAVGAAAVGVGAAMVGASRNTDRFSQVMRDLGPVAEATGVNLESAASATNTLYVATGDLEGSTAAVKDTMTMYGDELNSVAGITLAAANNYMIMQQGIMDISEAQKIVNQTQNVWEASILESNAAVQAGIDLMAEYGPAAEDIGDTVNEWSDTFKKVGYDMNEFFAFMNVGMALGARSTDELGNMVNELYLSIIEPTPEAIAALESIGMSVDEVQKAFEDGTGPEKIAEIIFALNELETAEEKTAAAAALFGTVGEEFVGPMLVNQKEQLEQLSIAYGLLGKMQNFSAQVQQGNLVPAMTETLMALGYSATEAENLIYKYETLGYQSLDAAGKAVVLSAGLKVNGAAMGITAEQTQALADKLIYLKDTSIPLSERILSLSGELIKYFGAGVLTEEQTKNLTASIEAQRAKVEEIITKYNEAGGALEILSSKVYEQAQAQGALSSEIDEATWKTMSYQDKVRELTGEQFKSTGATQEAIDITQTYNESQQTAADKAVALKDTLIMLHEAGFDMSIEKLGKLVPLITEMSAGFDGSVISSNNLTGGFTEMGKELDLTGGELEYFIEYNEDAKTAMDKAKESARKLSDNLYDVGDSADYATGEIEDLNDALKTNATLPPPQSAPSGSSRSYVLPQVSGLNNHSTSNSTNSVTTNNSPTFNATVIINGSSLSEREQKIAVKSAFEELWFEKGRLL